MSWLAPCIWVCLANVKLFIYLARFSWVVKRNKISSEWRFQQQQQWTAPQRAGRMEDITGDYFQGSADWFHWFGFSPMKQSRAMVSKRVQKKWRAARRAQGAQPQTPQALCVLGIMDAQHNSWENVNRISGSKSVSCWNVTSVAGNYSISLSNLMEVVAKQPCRVNEKIRTNL